MLPRDTLESLVAEYKTVGVISEFLGVEKCVLRAYIRNIPELNKEVQRVQQAPYRKDKSTVESTPDYKRRLRKDLCVYCNAYPHVPMTIDHIVPASKGGENHMHNYAAACRNCNAKKADTDLLTFMLEQRQEEACTT